MEQGRESKDVRKWRRVYALVIGSLVIVIFLLYLFTICFR